MRPRRQLVAVLAALAGIASVLTLASAGPASAAAGGSITIIEDAEPSDGQDFRFTGCLGAGCAPFTLDDDADPAFADRITGIDLAPATYSITQAESGNWALTQITCSAGGTVDLAGRRATVILTAGAHVTCTFRHRSPTIKIVQDTIPDDAQDFGFTGCLGSGCGTFTLDDDTDPTLPSTTSATGLALGTYTVTQSPTANWSLANLTCNGPAAIDIPNRRVAIVLDQVTDQRTCWFTDTTQSITIVEDDLADSGTDYVFTGCQVAGCSTVVLDDDTEPTKPARHESGPIPTGTYTITQGGVPGHELTGLGCEGQSVDLSSRRARIELASGQHVVCTFTNRPVPPLLSGVAEVVAGTAHTCARLVVGEVLCWGVDSLRGAGVPEQSSVLSRVLNPRGDGPLTGVVDLAIGDLHTCAALADGHAVCWGVNDQGQLGGGTVDHDRGLWPAYVLDPSGTTPLTGVTDVSAGWKVGCARLTSGQARCWGYNAYGQLGDQTTVGSSLPVAVFGSAPGEPLTGIRDLANRFHNTCALLDGGQVRCWGAGPLGDGTNTRSLTPVIVSNEDGSGPLTDVRSISATFGHVCVTTGDGHATCWGLLDHDGGTLATRPRLLVRDGEPLTGVTSVAAGSTHTCAVADDTVLCAGDNEMGQLGDGSPGPTRRSFEPVVDVRGLPGSGASTVFAGYRHSCAVHSHGQVACWGNNDNGRLGDGTRFDRPFAVPVIDH